MSARNRFGPRTTALEVVQAYKTNLKSYEVIVTGASSGIGVETARALAQAGARVVIGSRDLHKGEQVAQDVRQSTGNPHVEVEQLELSSLASVNAFVQRYLAKDRPLHILINNAGIMACPLTYTEDGFESQFGTNHMGHFALTVGLLPALRRGVKESGRKARIVNVSSVAHAYSDVDFNDVNFTNGREYQPFISYGQSKTANILFANALNKHLSGEGIFSNSLMPGVIMTGLQKNLAKEELLKRGWADENGNALPHDDLKSVEQGASTSVWVAVAPELDGVGGKYYVSWTMFVVEIELF